MSVNNTNNNNNNNNAPNEMNLNNGNSQHHQNDNLYPPTQLKQTLPPWHDPTVQIASAPPIIHSGVQPGCINGQDPQAYFSQRRSYHYDSDCNNGKDKNNRHYDDHNNYRNVSCDLEYQSPSLDDHILTVRRGQECLLGFLFAIATVVCLGALLLTVNIVLVGDIHNTAYRIQNDTTEIKALLKLIAATIPDGELDLKDDDKLHPSVVFRDIVKQLADEWKKGSTSTEDLKKTIQHLVKYKNSVEKNGVTKKNFFE